MNKGIYASLFILAGCASGNFTSDLSPNSVVLPTQNDAGSNLPSLEVPIGLPKYDFCFQQEQESTNNPRLNEVFCIDSFGFKHPHDYYDSTLNIHCRFQVADDGVNRCLPENEGSSPVFSDSNCQTPMGFARDEDLYLGIDSFDETGSKKIVLEYLRGDAWKNVGAFYYLVLDKNHRSCMSTYFMPLNVSLYYLGDKLSSTMFVAQ